MFTCEVCGKEFGKKTSRNKHRWQAHPGAPIPDVCTKCDVPLTADNWSPSQIGKYRICHSCHKKEMRDRYHRNKERRHKKVIQKNRERKLEVLDAYGGCCACCGETRPEFLSIDHINGDGAQHRREIGEGGTTLYAWLKKQRFPSNGFRVLCYNCNLSLGKYGYCPHQSDRCMGQEFLEEYKWKRMFC